MRFAKSITGNDCFISDAREQIKQEFLEENYKNYRELCDYDVISVIKQLADMKQSLPVIDLAKRIHFREMPNIFRLDNIDITKTESLLRDYKDTHRKTLQDWQISLIQTPHQSYSGEEDPILVVDEQGEVKTLSDLSFMIHAISDKREQTTFLCIDKMIADDKPVQQLIEALKGYECLMVG